MYRFLNLGVSFDLHLKTDKYSNISHDHTKYINQYLQGIAPRVFN